LLFEGDRLISFALFDFRGEIEEEDSEDYYYYYYYSTAPLLSEIILLLLLSFTFPVIALIFR